MRPLQKVLWTKGVLLNPQHLQLQDGYLEALVAFQLGVLRHAPWGFTRLEIDQESLAAGSLAIRSASGLFPDGLPFLIPESDQPPPPKPFQDHWRPDQQSMQLYLAVPELREGAQNVAMRSEGQGTRFVAEAVLRRDENTGLAEKPLQLARRNLQLLAEGEALEGFSLLPVARVIRSEAGTPQLDPHYVPPVLDVAASGYLVTLARRLLEILSARSSTLAGTRRQRNRGLADFGSSDVANFWLLYTINRHLPVVRHLSESRRTHPESLFRELLALGGALTTFSQRYHPRDLPGYDHDDLGGCFGRLDAIIRELLETVVPIHHVVIPLRSTGTHVYAAALDEERLFAGTQLFLGIRCEASAEEVARRAPQLVKLSSGDQIERLIRHALPGLPMRYLATPPGGVPIKLDYQYFQLERTGSDWDAIRTARNLAAYVPADFPEAQLELVVLLPSG